MSSRRQHIIALIITLLFHGAVLAVLMLIYLRYNPSETLEREWPPVDSSEVLFGGEYVMVGDTPEPDMADEPSPEAAEETSATVEQTPAAPDPTPEPVTPKTPAVASKTPSPAKVDDRETAAAREKAERERAAAEQAKREQETRDAIASRVKFGKNGSSGSGSGKSGSPDGNSDMGKSSGTPGYSLGRRTIASWKTPPSAPIGSITISVTVNREGHVVAASYQSGTGAAAASTKARTECVNAAKQSRFSVDPDAPVSQKGTITYHFK